MYKKLLLTTCFSLLLFGCATKEIDSTYVKDYVKNPQITSDAKLSEPNDQEASSKGVIRLLQANFEQQKFKIGPMKLTIYDTKLLQVEPDVSMLDYFHLLTAAEEFTLVKAFLMIENTSDEHVQFNPASLAISSTGEQWTWEQEAYLDELNGSYEPGQVKKGNVGFILVEKELPHSLTLQTSAVFDEDKDIVSAGTKVVLPLSN